MNRNNKPSKGLTFIGDTEYMAAVKELKDNLTSRDFIYTNTWLQTGLNIVRKKILLYFGFLKHKRCGKVKACVCVYGHLYGNIF